MRSPASRSVLSWYVYTLLSPSYTILYHTGYPSTCEITSPSHQICFIAFQASYFALFDNVHCFWVFLILHFFPDRWTLVPPAFPFYTSTSLSKASFFIFKTYLYLYINQLCGQLTNHWLSKFANTWLDLWTSYSFRTRQRIFGSFL